MNRPADLALSGPALDQTLPAATAAAASTCTRAYYAHSEATWTKAPKFRTRKYQAYIFFLSLSLPDRGGEASDVTSAFSKHQTQAQTAPLSGPLAKSDKSPQNVSLQSQAFLVCS